MGWVASEGFVVNLIQSCLITVTKEERKNTHTSHTSLQRNPVADPGEGPREPPLPPPLFLDQTEARRAEKNSFGDWAAPFLRVWMTGAPLSQGLDPALISFMCGDCDVAPSICLYLLLVSFVSSLYLEVTVCLLHARDFNSVRDCT